MMPNLQGSYNLQAPSPTIQGGSPQLQAGNTGTGNQRLNGNISDVGVVLGANTTATQPTNVPAQVDPYAAERAAAAAKAAEDARRAGQLRGQVTGLVNSIKDIFNQRYGQVDAAAGEQVGKLNERFATESGDIANQVAGEGEKIGAAASAAGTYDSSYRGNNVDTVKKAGESQIRDIGTELQDNIAKIAAWVNQQKTGFDATKGSMDQILGSLGETTDLGELTSLKATLDNRITELRAGAADNNTMAQNAASLNTIAPSSSRAVQLKTTLSQILAGNADKGTKSAIANKLVTNSGLTPEEQQALLQGFTADMQASDRKQTQA